MMSPTNKKYWGGRVVSLFKKKITVKIPCNPLFARQTATRKHTLFY